VALPNVSKSEEDRKIVMPV